jgi:hypothetical protein
MKTGTWKSFFIEWCKLNFTPIFCSFLLMWMEFGTDSLHVEQVWILWKSVQRHTLPMGVHEIFPHIFCIFLLSWIKFGTGDVHYNLIESFMNTGIVKQYFGLGHKWVCTFHFFVWFAWNWLSQMCTCTVECLWILWKLAKWRPYFFLMPGNKITFTHVLWNHMIHKKSQGRPT